MAHRTGLLHDRRQRTATGTGATSRMDDAAVLGRAHDLARQRMHPPRQRGQRRDAECITARLGGTATWLCHRIRPPELERDQRAISEGARERERERERRCASQEAKERKRERARVFAFGTIGTREISTVVSCASSRYRRPPLFGATTTELLETCCSYPPPSLTTTRTSLSLSRSRSIAFPDLRHSHLLVTEALIVHAE